MKRFGFSEASAFSPSDKLLESVSIVPLSAPMTSGANFQAAIFRLGVNGRIHRHPASVPQILAVLEGRGEVCGHEGIFEPVMMGDAVFFDEGEEHETRTSGGLVALVLEGPGLTPFSAP